MTSANVSDEPIAFCDYDALERLRESPTCSSSTTGRSRRAPTTRSCARPGGNRAGDRRKTPSLRRSRGYVPHRIPLARRRHAAPAARLRCRAQEHVLHGSRRSRVGQPPHRRPRELRDAALVHRGDRALRSAVRGRARGRRPRPPSRVPVDEVRARSGRRRADRGPAPSRAPGRVPRRAWRARARARRDLRRHRVRAPTAPSGAASCCSAICARSAESGRCCRSRFPAVSARSGSRGGWRAHGCRPRFEREPRPSRHRWRPASIPGPGRRCIG